MRSRAVPYLPGAERVQVASHTLTCRVERGGPVLVSFFGNRGLGQAAPRERAEGSKVRVASLLDVSCCRNCGGCSFGPVIVIGARGGDSPFC